MFEVSCVCTRTNDGYVEPVMSHYVESIALDIDRPILSIPHATWWGSFIPLLKCLSDNLLLSNGECLVFGFGFFSFSF